MQIWVKYIETSNICRLILCYAIVLFIYLLLNRTRSTEYIMKINKLRSQLAHSNVQNNVVQLVAR